MLNYVVFSSGRTFYSGKQSRNRGLSNLIAKSRSYISRLYLGHSQHAAQLAARVGPFRVINKSHMLQQLGIPVEVDLQRGHYLREALRGTSIRSKPVMQEKELHDILLKAISLRPEVDCRSEINTIDSGRMDIIVFDTLNASDSSRLSKSNEIPGRPTCLVECKIITIENLVPAVYQCFRYEKTLIGRHAGVECLPVIVFNGRSFIVGYAEWSCFSALGFCYCVEKFSLDGYIF